MRPKLGHRLVQSMQTEIIELDQLAAPKRPHFGEFLVAQQVLDRFQLFRALQMQDRLPGARLGQCAVALGYVPKNEVEKHHSRFAYEVQLETMPTEAFLREFDIDVDAD